MTFLLKQEARWIRVVLFGVIFAFLPLAIDYCNIYFSEREDYFHYTKTVVQKGSVSANDEVIRVISYMEAEKYVRLRYKDVLRCSDGAGFEFTDSNDTSSFIKKGTYPNATVNQDGDVVPLPWRFNVNANLARGDKCRIDSTVCALPGFGIEDKFCQDVSTNTFVIQ